MDKLTAFSYAFVVLLTSICLFSVSFSLLAPLEMALKYNENIHLLNENTVYGGGRGDSGRFFTGLKINFIKFPKKLQQIEFSDGPRADLPRMMVRTGPDSYSDKTTNQEFAPIIGSTPCGQGGSACEANGGGVVVELSIALQYQYKRDAKSLLTVYKHYGGVDAHRAAMMNYVKSITMDVASTVQLRQWWENRKEVGEHMLAAFQEKLSDPEWAVDARMVQIIEVTIPGSITAAIERTAAKQQDIGTAENNLEVQRVLAETNVVVALETQKNYGIQAEGFAYQQRKLAQAEATALDTVTTTEMEQYNLMRAKLNVTNKEFFTYLWMRAVDHNKLSRKVLEVPVPSAIREGVAHAS